MAVQVVKPQGLMNQQQELANVLIIALIMELKDIIIQIKHAKVIIFSLIFFIVSGNSFTYFTTLRV